MTIEWNDKLKTGIAIIDGQHQELIVMLNRLGRFRCGKEDFCEALKDLQEYVNTHFKTEEEYMVGLKYPKYNEHKACHYEFVKNLKELREKLDNLENICDLGDELFHFAEDWIMKHYSEEDVELVNYIKQNP